MWVDVVNYVIISTSFVQQIMFNNDDQFQKLVSEETTKIRDRSVQKEREKVAKAKEKL